MPCGLRGESKGSVVGRGKNGEGHLAAYNKTDSSFVRITQSMRHVKKSMNASRRQEFFISSMLHGQLLNCTYCSPANATRIELRPLRCGVVQQWDINQLASYGRQQHSVRDAYWTSRLRRASQDLTATTIWWRRVHVYWQQLRRINVVPSTAARSRYSCLTSALVIHVRGRWCVATVIASICGWLLLWSVSCRPRMVTVCGSWKVSVLSCHWQHFSHSPTDALPQTRQ